MASVTPAAEREMDVLREFVTGVGQDLMMLACLHHAEPSADTLKALHDAGFPDGLGLRLQSKRSQEALALVRDALRLLGREPETGTLDELAADYADIYLSHTLRASPYESVWFDEEQLERQEAMFQVRAYYHRHGLEAGDWQRRADDHLALQLQFISHLLQKGPTRADLTETARFMDDHLLRWLPAFAERVAARCATPFFAGLGLLTAAYCEEMRDALADVLGEARPEPEEVEQRMAPKPSQVVEFDAKYVPGAAPSW